MTIASLTRRAFLKAGGSLVVTFSLGGLASGAEGAAPTLLPTGDPAGQTDVDGFLAIAPDGKVTVFSGKVDLGTGVRTALAQMAAEELCVPLERVSVVQGDTEFTRDQGPTFGSLSIQIGGVQIRQAAATARERLLDEGAKRLKVPRDAVTVRLGSVEAAGGRKVTYGALVAGKKLSLKVDAKAPLRDPATFTIVGKPVPRLDILDKVTGRFTYVHDFKVRGMLHARVLRPRALKASLASVDDAEARKVPGFVATVRKADFLAVVASSEWSAMRAAGAVRAEWSDWRGLPDHARLWEHVRATKVVRDEEAQKAGDSAQALAAVPKRLSATYDFAIQTHGSLGPSCAVADYKGGRLTCWTASQATHYLRAQLAYMLGLDQKNVRCIYLEGSGCYGRNGHEDAAADAALVAKELGRPVRVQWSRADEHGWDPKGPPTLIDYRGGVDADGKLVAWESEGFLPEPAKQISAALLTADLAGLPNSPPHPGTLHRSLPIQYAVPNVKVTVHWLAETPFRPSWIRSPGRLQNTFGNECFLDECAAAAGADPLEFRRRYLSSDPRALELLERLAKLSGWTPRPPGARTAGPGVARGRGVSYVKFELTRTYVGAVAEVEVDRTTGRIRVTRFYVAHDCGQIINPDGVRNQIEGNVVQTVSRTLLEEVKFDRSSVTSVDWASYPILTFADVPEVVIDLIDRPKEKPWGAGEPTANVVPSAIANAVHDATGARLRSVPFTPEKVLTALQQA